MMMVRLLFLLCTLPAFASEGLIGAAGDYSAGVGNAAATNRRMADQLFQQALADEKTALSSFPPNIGLLAKAGVMAMDGIKADQQAKHFGAATMNGMNTGSNAGQFDAKNYGGLSEAQIRDLATNSSAYRGAAQSHIEGWGFKVNDDDNSISLPLGLGKVSLSIGLDMVEKGMTTAAKILGYDPSDISKGIQQAVAQRDAMAAQAQAELAARIAALEGKSREGGATTSALNEAANKAANSVPASDEGEVVLAGQVSADEAESRQLDMLERETELGKYRDLLKLEMGLKKECPIGRADQNLFNMIHAHYQLLRRQDAFIESTDQILASGH